VADDLSEELRRNIPLSEMIASLRQELKVALKEGDGDAVRFEVKKIQLELQVAVEKERSLGGKVKFWVVGLGAKSKDKHHDVHVFKLEIEPTLLTPDGQGGFKAEPLKLAGANPGRPQQD
jgi:hypothetical protein